MFKMARSTWLRRFTRPSSALHRCFIAPEDVEGPLCGAGSVFEVVDKGSQDEDDTILGVIRRVTRPNAAELARLLPQRSEMEVRHRIAELRDRIRRKYEAQGILPPQWCYAHD